MAANDLGRLRIRLQIPRFASHTSRKEDLSGGRQIKLSRDEVQDKFIIYLFSLLSTTD